MTPLARRPGRACLALVLATLLVGCVRVASGPDAVGTPGGEGSPAVTLPPRPTPPPTLAAPSATPGPTATPNDGAQVVEVSLLDSLEIEPGRMTVEAGKPVRFVVTNKGALEHDFFIGSDREQRQRESGAGEPGPDRYIAVPPGQTVTLLTTFPSAGKTIAGCVIPGHYSAGMKATLIIE